MSRSLTLPIVALAAALFVSAAACSPEAERTRGGGLGADIGNRGDIPQPGIAPSPEPYAPVTPTSVAKPAGSPSPVPGDTQPAQPIPGSPSPSPSPLPGSPPSPTVRPSG